MLIDGENEDQTGGENEIIEDIAEGGAELHENGNLDDGAKQENEKPLSIREALQKAQAEAKTKSGDGDKTQKKIPPKDEKGKFTKASGKPDTAAKPVTDKTAKPVQGDPAQNTALLNPADKPIEPNKYLNRVVREKWAQLPREVQTALNQRETEFEAKLSKQDEERTLARKFTEVINPYLPQIRAEGAEPIKAVAELLNTAYLLRTASPLDKGRLLWDTARQFGADMRQGLQTQAQQGFDPRLHAINQQVAQLQGEIKKQNDLRVQQEQGAITGLIEVFAADKEAHPYFEEVKADMAALLQGGRAKDLQDAYDKAVFANPDTRSALLAANKAGDEGKRVADEKAKADKAKKAGSSVKGGPGMVANRNGQIPSKDLRSELKAQFRARSDS